MSDDARSALTRPDVPALDASPPVLCWLCGRTKVFRRTLCRSCYRKLRHCGCPMPPRGRWGGRTLEGRFATWLRLWPAPVRVALMRALVASEGGGL